MLAGPHLLGPPQASVLDVLSKGLGEELANTMYADALNAAPAAALYLRLAFLMPY